MVSRRKRLIGLAGLAAAVVVVASLALIHRPAATSSAPAVSPSPKALVVPLSLTQRCSEPTATTSTDDVHPAGDPASPRVGPVSFHPGPFAYDPQTEKPYPTKILITPIGGAGDVVTLMGEQCGDGTTLRFAYNDVSPAFAEDRAVLTLNSSADGFAGYMLFTGPGTWTIDVFGGGNYLGNLLIRVVAPLPS